MADLLWLFLGAALFTATALLAHGCAVLQEGRAK